MAFDSWLGEEELKFLKIWSLENVPQTPGQAYNQEKVVNGLNGLKNIETKHEIK